jgi:hypothetical protein
LKTFVDQAPCESFLAQDLVLRIDEYNCSVLLCFFQLRWCLN